MKRFAVATLISLASLASAHASAATYYPSTLDAMRAAHQQMLRAGAQLALACNGPGGGSVALVAGRTEDGSTVAFEVRQEITGRYYIQPLPHSPAWLLPAADAGQCYMPSEDWQEGQP